MPKVAKSKTEEKTKEVKKPATKKIVVEAVVPVVKVVPKAAKRSEKIENLQAEVRDLAGKIIETISLPKEIFGAALNKQLIAQAVRVHLANTRRGTVSTKTRGEVRGSTRKIYRQKGTGRARHGGVRAPIFVHGGLVFGPKPRDYSLAMPQKMRRKALFTALSAKMQESTITFIAGLDKIEPKTKAFVATLKSLALDGKEKSILLVLPSMKEHSNLVKAARNVPGISYMQANGLNTYDVLRHKAIIMTKDAVKTLQDTFLKG